MSIMQKGEIVNGQEWPTEERIDTIGPNGNTGEHYLANISITDHNLIERLTARVAELEEIQSKYLIDELNEKPSERKKRLTITSLERQRERLREKNRSLAKTIKVQKQMLKKNKSNYQELKKKFAVLKEKFLKVTS